MDLFLVTKRHWTVHINASTRVQHCTSQSHALPALRLSCCCTISQTPGSVHIRKWPCPISGSCVFEWCMQCWCILVGEKEGRVGVGPGSSAPDWLVTSATWSFFSNSCSSIPPSFQSRPPKPCLSGRALRILHPSPNTSNCFTLMFNRCLFLCKVERN